MGVNNYLGRFNEELIKTYKQFRSICETYNLRYFAYGGTCIGAIRHQNIIPWDDDIDILMPRDDYYKFLDIKNEIAGSGYDIISYRDKGFYFPFTKFINTNTTIWESPYNPFVIGAFVDVFPLYTSNETIDVILAQAEKYIRLYSDASRSMGSYPISRILYALSQKKFRRAMGYVKSKLFYSDFSKYIDVFETFEKTLDSKCGDKVISFASRKYGIEKEIFSAEWFSDYIVTPFADTDIRVPVGYDAYLKFVFGDYMVLPPVEKRISDHNKFYVNLKEGLTLDQVKLRVLNGEKCVY